MRPTVSINNAEFARVLEQVAKESSRTFPQVVNGQSLALATRALRSTAKTDPARIAVELGQVSSRISVSGKTGKIRKAKVYSQNPNTLAYRIVVSRLLDSGASFTDQDVQDKVKRLRAARIRSAAFIRSGWIYAIRALATSVGYKDARGSRPRSGEAARMTGAAKGFARPAARGAISSVVSCEIGNSALLQDKRSPMPVALAGLNIGFAESIKDMRQHLTEKLNGVFKKYHGK